MHFTESTSVSDVQAANVAGAMPGYFFYDSFQVPTDGADLDNHVGERATWVQVALWGVGGVKIAKRTNGDCEFRGNTVGGEITYNCQQDAAVRDHSVTGVVVLRSDDNLSAIGFGLGSNYAGTYGIGVRYNCNGNAWEIISIIAGVVAVVTSGSFSQTLTADQLYTVKLSRSNNSYTLTVDNAVLGTVTTTALDAMGPGSPFLYSKGTATATTGVHLTTIYGQDGAPVVPWDMRKGFIFVGDSNGTNDQHASVLGYATIPQRIARTLNCPHYNLSLGGRSLQNIADGDLTSAILLRYTALSPLVETMAAILQPAVNDFGVNGRTSVQVLGNAVTAVGITRTMGFLVTILCNAATVSIIAGAEETERAAYVTAATAAATGANRVSNLSVAFPASTNTIVYLADALHYTPAGFQLAADIFTADIRIALSSLEMDRVVTKTTSGNYTIGTTNPRELYGGVIYVTGAATLTIPAAAAGMNFTVITIGAVAVSVDPNAADLIVLDGTALSDGDKITNLSTAGDIAVFSYYDATGFHASTNGWTDGN